MMKTKNPEMKTDRLEMFSDGVFAIAITLLILEVKIPKHEELAIYGGLDNYLIHIWPSYVTYFISFIVLGIYWSNHHWMFTFFIKKTDHVFNMLNILFLSTIAFLPFSTAILGDFILDEASRKSAITLYCMGYLFPPLSILIIFIYAVHRKRLIDKNLTNSFIKRQILKLLSGVVLISLATIISFQYPIYSLGLIAIILLIYLLPPDKPEYVEGNE